MLTRAQKDFVDYIMREEALKFGDFTLKSGRKSPFFFNIGDFASGEKLVALASFYGDFIHEKRKTGELEPFNIIFGPSYKGIPLAVATTLYLFGKYGMEVCYCANRKEAKRYGDIGNLLGAKLKSGDRVLIIEDVTTSGKSIEEVMPIIKAQGDVEVVGEIIALDRCERADGTRKAALRVISEKYGFSVMPIVRMDDVISYLHENGRLDADIHLKLRDYYAEYGGK